MDVPDSCGDWGELDAGGVPPDSGCEVQVLRSVYSNDQKNVDSQLVASIVAPAQHPNAAEVFYRVITGRGQSLNSLLDRMQAPLFLLW